jgi:hypothetical protein
MLLHHFAHAAATPEYAGAALVLLPSATMASVVIRSAATDAAF